MGRLVTLVAVVFSLLGLVPVQAGSDKVAERNKSGVELLKQGKADKAIPEFKKAIELDPDNASVHLNLAYAYDLQGSVVRQRQRRSYMALARGHDVRLGRAERRTAGSGNP